jgi:RNA-splicing ligase RtcB
MEENNNKQKITPWIFKMKTWTLIYRTGGTENFKWNKTHTFPSYDEAHKAKIIIEKMGYKTFIHDTGYLENIGLPETYEY